MDKVQLQDTAVVQILTEKRPPEPPCAMRCPASGGPDTSRPSASQPALGPGREL